MFSFQLTAASLPLRNSTWRSYGMIEILNYFHQKDLIQLQGINKHAYTVFALRVIPSVPLFLLGNVAKGYCLKVAQSCIYFTDLSTFTWKDIAVGEKGDPTTQQQKDK